MIRAPTARCCPLSTEHWTLPEAGAWRSVNLDALQVIFAEKRRCPPPASTVEAGNFQPDRRLGCGKSTILRVLAGLQREWRGGVQLFGKAIAPGVRFQGELRREHCRWCFRIYASLP